MRAAEAILSTENLHHNIRLIKHKVGRSKIVGMVKANAYGHGTRSVGKRLENEVDLLGVASINEALSLREAGVKIPVLLNQGIYEANELELASKENFHIVFNNETQLEWLANSTLNSPLNGWIKVNTGMGRLGFHPNEVRSALDKLKAHPQIDPHIRLMSHFSCSDEKTHPLNQEQIKSFTELFTSFDTEYSLCNSAGVLNFSECHYDYVRPGLIVYGLSPIKGCTGVDFGLKPVMTVKSTLMSVQTQKKGSSIGYGARYKCPEDMPVGVVAFGYGDGYPISARDGAPVLVGDILCPMIGRPSMDMIAVDLRGFPNASVGQEVTLWGEGLPVEHLAEFTDTIVWNIVTSVQNRVKFVWST